MDKSKFDDITKLLGQRTTRRAAMRGTTAGLALGYLSQKLTGAQEGTPAATMPADIEILFVQSFASGTATPASDGSFSITLEGGSGHTTFFSDRPERMAGALPTESFLDGRAFDPTDPPNAAIVAGTLDGQDILVVELRNPAFDTATGAVTYQAQPLSDQPSETLASLLALQEDLELEGTFGPVTLFIDNVACVTDGSDCSDDSQCCSNICCEGSCNPAQLQCVFPE